MKQVDSYAKALGIIYLNYAMHQ